MTTQPHALAESAAVSSVGGQSATRQSRPRRDIQGLRALAVVLVLFYHLWPNRVRGGFVGVDIFFVISGFLITSNILRVRLLSIADLLAFWARRVRRLLPAATIVLVVTAALSFAFIPITMFERTAKEIVSSTAYVENWALTLTSADYLAADNVPTPVQHYWSLSVEEQFYIFWPILLSLALYLGTRRTSRINWRLLVMLSVFVCGFAASLVHTALSPSSAYFATDTRIWELAVGGILAERFAWFQTRLRLARAPLAWAGLALCLASALAIGPTVPFPGVAAMLPVAGAALVLMANADTARGSPSALMSLAPVQFVGDVSYSLYLWHWPLITIAPYALDHRLRFTEKLGVAILSVVLAAVSKRWVEDPVRHSRRLRKSMRKTFTLAAILMLVSALSGFALLVYANVAAGAGARLESEAQKCLGAASLDDPSCTPFGNELMVSPVLAAEDLPEVYSDGCWNYPPFVDRNVCHYGETVSPTKRIALIGNSHAGQWEPPLDLIGKKNGWQVDTYIASGCYNAEVEVRFDEAGASKGCKTWASWANSAVLNGNYDAVVVANWTARGIADVPKADTYGVAEKGYSQVLKRWADSQIPVLVIRDTPHVVDKAPDCLAANPKDFGACAVPQRKALTPDPLFDAGRSLTGSGIAVVDPTDRFCRDKTCHSAIGGLPVYFDASHMTKSYAESLESSVASWIDTVLNP